MQTIIDFYTKKKLQHTNRPEQLGWCSEGMQYLRFSVLTHFISDMSNHSILDVGCGHGDLYSSFNKKPKLYVGIDCFNESLKIAKDRTRDYNSPVLFICCDFLAKDFVKDESYDYVFASGTFNLQRPDYTDLFIQIEQAIIKMWKFSNIGISFNFLSTKAKLRQVNYTEFVYYDPLKVLEVCFRLTPYVSFFQNYSGNEATIVMHKENNNAEKE